MRSMCRRCKSEPRPQASSGDSSVAKAKTPSRTDNDIRAIMLHYFYDRNKNATSARGKKGSAIKISDVKSELKASHSLSQQEVQSNLTYLISQGWVDEQAVEKSFTAPGGTVIPSSTSFYQISAAGIDKIDGPGEFTMNKVPGHQDRGDRSEHHHSW